MSTWRILTGDVRDSLKSLPEQSVQTCVTSPPYWGLRDYGVTGQLGLESTPEAYVAAMVEVFREVRRVLKDDGTLWLNLGDSYCSQGGTHDGREDNQPGVGAKRVWRDGSGRADGIVDERGQRNRNGNTVPGLKAKDLVGIPWMVAFALRADGWYLRSDIIWSKPNPMPESVTDRPTKAHEYIFLLSKSKSYYYDAAAIAEKSSGLTGGRFGAGGAEVGRLRQDSARPRPEDTGERNKRSVWQVATQPYPDAHFATFPEALIEPCILAGSADWRYRARPIHRIRHDWRGCDSASTVVRRLRVESGLCRTGPYAHRRGGPIVGSGGCMTWLSAHLGTVLALGLFLAAGTYIISAAVYAIWMRHEGRQQDAQRKRLEALVRLSSQSTPTAPGFPHKRVS